jgi:16S rRNA (guanine527-N7)-methyltransferase
MTEVSSRFLFSPTSARAAFIVSASPRRLVLRHHQCQPLSIETTTTSITSSSALYASSLENEGLSSTSTTFAMDPWSDEARSITKRLGLTETQHKRLADLATLVVEWNERINLVSRRDCSVQVVFGRHILPSIALLGIDNNNNPLFKEPSTRRLRIVDVGTGGGFPGLPLAIALPEANFLLVDSVGKKLKAVEAMGAELGLDNVHTHHGRAEELVEDPIMGKKHRHSYDVCLGRSVTSIPKFCFWVHELLQQATEEESEAGKLLYIIGGDIDGELLAKTEADESIEDLLGQDRASDKRALVFDAAQVSEIAAASGETKQVRRSSSSAEPQNKNKKSSTRRRKKARGQWTRREDDKPKQRGYENFKRYGY